MLGNQHTQTAMAEEKKRVIATEKPSFCCHHKKCVDVISDLRVSLLRGHYEDVATKERGNFIRTHWGNLAVVTWWREVLSRLPQVGF